ncbi:MAG TPA: cation diffusion facilitator family transporter [Bacteroidia bacterium]|nr:cation diffusion facilitator family transporter [Bacteroidia bacterium]
MDTVRKPSEPIFKKASATPVIVTMCLNLVFAGIKGVAAFFGNSNALMADAAESFADVMTSAIVWIGIKTAVKEPDEDHPYGHGKAEPVASIVVAIFLLITSVLIASRGVERIWSPPAIPQAFTLWILLCVIAFKEGSYRYLKHKANNIGSTAMLSEALHSRSDAVTSIMAFIGISVAIWTKYIAADAYASLVAAVIIAFNAMRIFRPAFNEIMDAAPPIELTIKVRQIAEKVEGVKEVEKCQLRKMGMHYFVDMHVVVDGNLSVHEGHEIAHRVKDAVREQLTNISDVLVHIEPQQ